MASYQTNTTRVAPFGAVSISRAAQFAAEPIAAFVAWNNARKTRKALYALTARELDDIGLCYADIDMIGR